MEVKARLRNLRIAPRKVRLVADLVRGKSVADARLQLKFNGMRAAKPLLKLIESGVANAQNQFNVDGKTLRIKTLVVDQGPMMKRYMARAFGRGAEIQKRMSHIRLTLEGAVSGVDVKQTTKKPAKVKEAKAEQSPVRESADIERHGPKKSAPRGKNASVSKKPEPVDPRMQGKQRNTRNSTGK